MNIQLEYAERFNQIRAEFHEWNAGAVNCGKARENSNCNTTKKFQADKAPSWTKRYYLLLITVGAIYALKPITHGKPCVILYNAWVCPVVASRWKVTWCQTTNQNLPSFTAHESWILKQIIIKQFICEKIQLPTIRSQRLHK